jgi:predicted nucleic acid-binding protein
MHRGALRELPVLDVLPDYWIRAAANRATLMSRKLRARLADALIAQSCIDHDIALITRDGDFRHFAKHCGLKLA